VGYVNNNRKETHMDNNITLNPPARLPRMATIDQENEWLWHYNEYSAANAADEGFTYYLKGLRNGSASGSIVWMVKEVGTDKTVEMFQNQDEALKALDAMEVK